MSSFPNEDYHVGIICALDSEMAAVEAMLDAEYETIISQDTNDHNAYTVGRIHAHNVVIACLPAGVDGLAAAATVAKDMSRTFGQLRFGLLVGIGGGIPDPEQKIDIRLGDVVVSEPTGITGGVVQYDKGKSKAGGEWERKGILNAPPVALLAAMQKLKARHLRHDSIVPGLLKRMFEQYPKMIRSGYAFPGQDQDCLRRAVQARADDETKLDAVVDYEVVPRSPRVTNDPEVHYGVIASGNQVVKDATVRERIRRDCNALCVEMEAAGLMNEFPCLVIRGICDYADAHKNNRWHRYAAPVAAAYAKELLLYVSAEQTSHEKPVQQILGILGEHFEQVHDYHNQHQAHLRQQETRYATDKQNACHKALKTSNYEEHKNRNPKRAPGTCRWLLDHTKYRRWRENNHNDLLWISADPGCGKSVLSRALVDDDLRNNGSDLDTTVCYFFFKDNDVQDRLTTALCAILHQLFDHQPQLIRHALPTWEKNGDKIASEVDKLWHILLTATADRSAQRVVCVLDALDECRDGDRGRLISMLCEFYRKTAERGSVNESLKFLVTSRPYEDIEHHFGRLSTSLPFIRLRGEDENDQLRREIDTVVLQCVRDIAEEFQLVPTTVARLEGKLLAMEHRTYLWLYLAMDSIRDMFSQSLRPDQEMIELLPASVDEAYEQILSKVNPKQKSSVKAILQIILGARRPLTMGEMALALDIATSTVTPHSFSDLSVREDQLVSRIRHWCGLFVFINHSRLYLIHQTAKEFLLRESGRMWIDSGKWKHCIAPTDIEREMARIYILYLSLDHFHATNFDNLDQSSALHHDNVVHNDDLIRLRATHEYTLFKLAAESWADHWRTVGATAEEDMKEKVWMLYDTGTRSYLGWTTIFGAAMRKWLLYSCVDIFMTVVYNGHIGVMRRMLDADPQRLQAQEYSKTTALMEAVEGGHIEAITFLLDAGANVNANVKGRTALAIASNAGRDRVVRVLLGAGADVNAAGDALWKASHSGHEKVVQTLLDAGANVHARVVGYGDALQSAIWPNREEVVQLLISAGADVNAPAGYFGSALEIAIKFSDERIVQLLLNAGVDVEARGQYGTALQLAAKSGNVKSMQMLIDAGVNVNAQGGDYGNALQAASRAHDHSAAQLLLDAGADVHAQGGVYGNALQAASRKGHDALVQRLLDAEVDVNAAGGHYGSALQAACHRGHTTVVQMLLHAGADVNKQGGCYGNALQAAYRGHHTQIVRLLYEYGATDIYDHARTFFEGIEMGDG